MGDDASSDGSAAGPALPAGVLKTRTAWAGDQLEMDHTREQMRRGAAADSGADPDRHHAAVDISQFQNTEVGSGYKARHVIRQKTGSGSSSINIRDMTVGGVSDTKGGQSGEDKRDSDKKETKIVPAPVKQKRNDEGDRYKVADQYLKCKGVREFRLELEKILSSS